MDLCSRSTAKSPKWNGSLRPQLNSRFAGQRRSDSAGSANRTMPVRRGHVAHQNTFLDTIIRKFEGQSKLEFITEFCSCASKQF